MVVDQDNFVNCLQLAYSTLQAQIQEFGYNVRKTWYMLLNNNMKLNLGRSESEIRLQRFLKIYHRLKTPSLNNIGDKTVLIDLRYTNGIAVRTAK